MKHFKFIKYIIVFIVNIFPNCTNLIESYQHHFRNAQAVIGPIRNILNRLPFLNQIPSHQWEGIIERIAARGIQFCPDDERQCFINFLTSHENLSGFMDKVRQCQPLNGVTIRAIRNNAGNLAQAVMLDYLMGNRTCAPLVQDYINFAKRPNSCSGTILVDKCNDIFGSNCEIAAQTIRAGLEALGVLQSVVGQIVQFGLTVKNGVIQAWNVVEQAARDAARWAEQAARDTARVAEEAARAVKQAAQAVFRNRYCHWWQFNQC
jgi:hypothetical protein